MAHLVKVSEISAGEVSRGPANLHHPGWAERPLDSGGSPVGQGEPGDTGTYGHQCQLDKPRGVSGTPPSRGGDGGKRLPELGRGQRGLPARSGADQSREPAGREALPGQLRWSEETPTTAVVTALATDLPTSWGGEWKLSEHEALVGELFEI